MNKRIPQPCLDPRGESKPGLDTDKYRHTNQFDEYNNLLWPKHNPFHIPLVKLPCLDRRGEVVTTESPQKYDYKYFSYQRYRLNIYDLNMYDNINYNQQMYDQKQEGLKYTIKNKKV